MKVKKVVYLSKEKFEQLVNGELEGKTYNPSEEQYLVDDSPVVRVYASGTMQTSTSPYMTVPKLTKEQIDEIYSYLGSDKIVKVIDDNGDYLVTEIDKKNEEIRFTYLGMYLGYYLEGSNVIAVYTTI